MKNIRFFLSENFQFSVVKFSIYFNRLVFVMGNWLLYFPLVCGLGKAVLRDSDVSWV